MTVDTMEELVRKENEKLERHGGRLEMALETSKVDETIEILEITEDDDNYDNIVSS